MTPDILDQIPITRGLLELTITALKQSALITKAVADGMKDESARRETMESVKGTIRLVQSIEAEMRR